MTEPPSEAEDQRVGTGSKFVAALLALAFSAVAWAAERPHIQFAEKVTLNAGSAQTHFDAYGRRFTLNLRSNDRALGALKLTHPGSIAGYRLWRGSLADQPGSWVRLTEHAGASEGVIWDGRDLYAVTRYDKVASYLGTPLSAQPGDTVIFRLSDSINLLPSGYCGTGPSADGLASNNSLVQYRNMVAELQAKVSAAATRQIEISMIADSAMQTRVADPIAEMLTSFNIVDGIYAEQIGLIIVPIDMRSIPASGDPFTATDPSALLAQLSTYRQNTPAIASLGIAHLFTGRELDGLTLGIARLGGACTAADAVSLTEAFHGALSQALVMAHEVGHNLGAEHDGTGACAAIPETFIMSPFLNGSERFSQCSLTAINAFIATAPASCITPAAYAHVELPQTTTTVIGELDEPLVVPFDLYSTGTLAINNVRLDLRLHPSLVLTATTPGVTCAPVTQGLSCSIGTIAAGVTKRVELTFLPGMQGGLPAEATVSASNNQNTRNSRQNVSINILPNVDVSVSVATSAPTATFGDNVDVTLTVRSLKTHTARNVRVGVYGAGLRGISANVPGGASCQFDSVNTGQTFCTLGDIPGGATRTIVVHSTAWQVGTQLQGTAYLSADNDSDTSNNNVYFTMNSIGAAHDVGLEDLTTSAPVQFNMPFEYRGNLRSYGLQSVSGVRVDVILFMENSTALDSVSSVTVGGNACARLANWHYDCAIGTMAAGEVLPISIRGIATALGETRVQLTSYAAINNNPSNDQVYRGWIVRYGLDASVGNGGAVNFVEGQEHYGSFAVWSNGTQPANNAVLNLELPAQVRFTRFSVREAATTSCAIVDAQHMRCTFNIPSGLSYQDVTYFVTSDVAGVYQASATLALAGDENPSNNNLQWPITVNAALDVGVRTSLVSPQYLFAGRNLTVPITVFTASRPVNGVSLNVYAQASSELVSVSTGAGACVRVDAHQYTCTLGSLAGGSTVAVTAVMTATSSAGVGVFGASVELAGDNVPNNNQISTLINIAPLGDARVTVAASSFTATAGTDFTLPSITVWRQGEVVGGKIRITLPAGITLLQVSGSAYPCSGTTTLECDLPGSWPESQGIQVDLRLHPTVAGSVVFTARVVAANDFTNSNDEASIAVTVNAAPAPPSNPPPSGGGGSSGGGGGGGGRIEWPVAFVLALILIRRQRRVSSVSA